MLRSMKKLVSLMLALSSSFVICIPAFAEESPSHKNIPQDFENYVENHEQNGRDSLTAKLLLQDFYKEHNNYNNDDYIPDMTITINSNEQVVFKDKLVNVITYSKAPASANKLSSVTSKLTSSQWKYTDIITADQAYYGAVFGNWLYTITQQAQFKYNGSTSECTYKNGYYQLPNYTVYHVENWQASAETHPNYDGENWCRISSTGHFKFSFGIQGADLSLRDYFECAYVECNRLGKINQNVYSTT